MCILSIIHNRNNVYAVNDVNSEIERLEHSISSMRNQIEKYKGQDASSNTQRKKTVRDLEDKLTKTDKKAEDYESRYNLAVRTINQLKNGIQSIFTRIGATSVSVDEMLGNQVNFILISNLIINLLVH